MKTSHPSEQLLLSEIQLILAEKRTYYSILRTGLGIITVPLTVIIFLTATREYHGLFQYFWVAAVVVIILLGMSAAGIFLFVQAQAKINRLQKLIEEIERENKRISEIVV